MHLPPILESYSRHVDTQLLQLTGIEMAIIRSNGAVTRLVLWLEGLEIDKRQARDLSERLHNLPLGHLILGAELQDLRQHSISILCASIVIRYVAADASYILGVGGKAQGVVVNLDLGVLGCKLLSGPQLRHEYIDSAFFWFIAGPVEDWDAQDNGFVTSIRLGRYIDHGSFPLELSAAIDVWWIRL